MKNIKKSESSIVAPLRAAAGTICAIGFLVLFQGAALARVAPDSFADLAEEQLPTVVNVSTEQLVGEADERQIPNLPPGSPFRDFFEEFFDNQQRGQDQDEDDADDGPPVSRPASLGSGFIVDSEGYVVTNNHVIGEADKVFVTLHDGDRLEAEIVGRDELLDIALLKVDAGHRLPAIKWGDSDSLRVGEWVMAIGNPFGLGGSVTAGIVSALERDINAGNYDYFIQTDASINRGNSGGPMFDMGGGVVGMNTMIFSPTGGNIGIGFAIPSSQVRQIIDQLREFGRARRGWIGVSIQAVTQEVADSLGLEKAEGAIIGSVDPDGPAAAAGIEPGDIILAFDGEVIEEMRELPRVVAGTTIGKKVKVKLLRQGKAKVVDLTTGELEPPETQVASAPSQATPDAPAMDRVLGLRLSSLTSQARAQLDLPDDVNGVVVSSVSRRSLAAFRDLRRGDVIVQVNQVDVSEPSQITEMVAEARDAGRRAVLFRIYRDGNFLHRALPIENDEE